MATTFDASGLSVVEFDLDYGQIAKDSSSPWPNGCLQVVRAESGTTFKVALKNANKKKYQIEIAGKTEKTSGEAVPEALKAILPLLGGAPAQPSKAMEAAAGKESLGMQPFLDKLSKMTRLQVEQKVGPDESFQVALVLFDGEIEKLGRIGKALDAAKAVESDAKDYDSLVSRERWKLAPDKDAPEELKECKTSKDDCRNALEGLDDKIREHVLAAKAQLAEMDLMARPEDKLRGYALELAKRKFEAANDLMSKAPEIAKTLAGHQDSKQRNSVEASVFTTVETIDFAGVPQTIAVKINTGQKDKLVTEYKMQIRVEPKKVNAFSFSSGFFFSGLVDRSYSVRDGKIERRGDEDQILPAVGVLAHWHPSSDGWAISSGVAGKGSELEYLVGASLLSGKTQRFVVSVGAAVGSVKRLDGVEVGDALSSTIVPTRDVVRVSWFGGVSFRF